MKKRKHKILDHPVLGYFILFFFAELLLETASRLDTLIARILPGYAVKMVVMDMEIETATGICGGLGALAAVGIFTLWFRGEFDGILGAKNLKKGLLMLLPFLLLHYLGSVVSWITFGTSSVLIAFLRALYPGIGEEVVYRGLGVANYMRTIKSEKKISVIFWMSSIIFGLVHVLNAFVGAELSVSLIQAFYAAGIGMLFCAVYLRTGNILPTIIAHASVDFLELVRADLGSSGGVMGAMGIGDWITIVAGVLAAVLALRMMDKKHYPEIMELWNEKWKRTEEEESDAVSEVPEAFT